MKVNYLYPLVLLVVFFVSNNYSKFAEKASLWNSSLDTPFKNALINEMVMSERKNGLAQLSFFNSNSVNFLSKLNNLTELRLIPKEKYRGLGNIEEFYKSRRFMPTNDEDYVFIDSIQSFDLLQYSGIKTLIIYDVTVVSFAGLSKIESLENLFVSQEYMHKSYDLFDEIRELVHQRQPPKYICLMSPEKNIELEEEYLEVYNDWDQEPSNYEATNYLPYTASEIKTYIQDTMVNSRYAERQLNYLGTIDEVVLRNIFTEVQCNRLKWYNKRVDLNCEPVRIIIESI